MAILCELTEMELDAVSGGGGDGAEMERAFGSFEAITGAIAAAAAVVGAVAPAAAAAIFGAPINQAGRVPL